MSEITEKEAIKRFVNALKECSASMLKLEDIDKTPTESKRFSYYIRDAIGCAHALGHYQKNPDFWRIRDSLELLQKQAAMLGFRNHFGAVPATAEGKNPFQALSEMLAKTCEIGQRIATSKALDNKSMEEAITRRLQIIQPEIDSVN